VTAESVWRCQRCDRPAVTPVAVSQASKESIPICAVCGELEAERVSRGVPLPPPDEWPLDAEELGREFELQAESQRGEALRRRGCATARVALPNRPRTRATPG
jgi:hypothetical protein